MRILSLAGGLTIGIRDRTDSDEACIYRSWLKHHREFGDWPRRMPTPVCPRRALNGPGVAECNCCRYTHRRYYDTHKLVIARIMERSCVRVACNPERPEQLLGFCVHEHMRLEDDRFRPHILHWIYVKGSFRWDRKATENPGIGTALMRDAFPGPSVGRITCSHWTVEASKIAARWGLVYEPFLLEAP